MFYSYKVSAAHEKDSFFVFFFYNNDDQILQTNN